MISKLLKQQNKGHIDNLIREYGQIFVGGFKV